MATNVHRTVQLWRVVFIEDRVYRIRPSAAGPWHPDKGHAERWMHWFAQLGFKVSLESNQR
ncbi:hypothetical protein [Caldimonas brevitalea]|uniref:Uncharacterized protein n=1 Tax=Caldimonas brevitalea TaxID=413882 RepID=A0A0G3BDR9_9BURK|nr:hypothetical protein [Caldimonas brevitalea]AKJ27437.1 hypothetical protein AAW51_0746 [Caldimonas brevitalea]